MRYLVSMTSTALVPTGSQMIEAFRADITQLAGAWLASLPSTATRSAYRNDLVRFSQWCEQSRLELLDVSRPAVDLFRLEEERAGLAPSTRSRRLTALASFYDYCESVELIRSNPVAKVSRPKVSHESQTLGLDKEEAKTLLECAKNSGPRDEALMRLLLQSGLRVSEACSIRIEEFDSYGGRRFVRVVGKGNKPRKAAVSEKTFALIGRVSEGRPFGAVFVGVDGKAMSRHAATRAVSRLARAAGITKKISPHSLRHTYVTLSLDAGVPLRDVQDGAGHASPETTMRYDRNRGQLDRSPTYVLSVFLGE